MDSRTKLAIVAAIIVIVVAIVAAIALNPGSSDKDDSEPSSGHAFPDPIEDGDRDYPTATEAEESYAKSIETLKSALSDSSLNADAMEDAILTFYEDYQKLINYYVWMSLDYNEKPEEFTDTYNAWDNLINHIGDDFAIALKESLSGPCAETAGEAMELCGLDPETYRNYNEMTQEEKDFNAKETELVSEYNNIMYGNYEMEYGGTTWTADSIENSSTLTQEQKDILSQLLDYSKCKDAADVYVELVQVRNDYAVLKGYDNYSTYAYEIDFGRDYTPTEAKSFCDLVDTALDVYNKITAAQKSDSSMSLDKLSWMEEYKEDGLLDLAGQFISGFTDEHAKLLDYMKKYDLIDIYTGEGRQERDYTQEIRYRGSAVMYIGTAGEDSDAWTDVSTIVHEFGHASNMCLNPDRTSCYDIMEIHSQGLEALYCTSGILKEGSRAMAADTLATLIYSSVFMPGLLTEIELWAYETEAETGSLTGDQVYDKFVSILESHGFSHTVSVNNGYLWTQVPHLFLNPHYYISYGTSAIGAIELLVEATEDYDAAKEKYLDLVFQQGIDGYSEAVEEAGFINAFDTEAVKALLEECISALKRVAA